MTATADELVERVLAGERRAAARLISLAENRDPAARAALRRIYPETGRAHVIGITGPPGSGKSTLVDKLIEHYREHGKTVGVVAVDPSSPFTGGALLGDRIRMQTRRIDRDVFIRSMGSRGSLGGLSRAAVDAVRVMDAMGKDVILVETVGVGQAEVDVIRLADTVVVVAVPGMGDEIQNIKAGLMEIADVFVVNKADREGFERTLSELQAWLEFAQEMDGWQVPVIPTVAEKGDGVADLADALGRHRQATAEAGDLDARRLKQAEHELLQALREHAVLTALRNPETRKKFEDAVHRIAERSVDPDSAAESLLP